MIYRVAVCEDEPEQSEELKQAVSAWAAENRFGCCVECFPSAEAFLFACGEEGGGFDVLLLDVEMRGMTGIALAKRLRTSGCRAEIIFITSHFEFAGEGYEVDALHYLVKPVSGEKLSAVLTRAAGRLAEEPASVLISCEGETVRLFEPDILYAEAFLHELAIHTKKGEYRTRESISAFAQRVGEDFFRAHRSYLINLRSVIRIGRTSVLLEGGAQVPLARGKYDEANRAFIARN